MCYIRGYFFYLIKTKMAQPRCFKADFFQKIEGVKFLFNNYFNQQKRRGFYTSSTYLIYIHNGNDLIYFHVAHFFYLKPYFHIDYL